MDAQTNRGASTINVLFGLAVGTVMVVALVFVVNRASVPESPLEGVDVTVDGDALVQQSNSLVLASHIDAISAEVEALIAMEPDGRAGDVDISGVLDQYPVSADGVTVSAVAPRWNVDATVRVATADGAQCVSFATGTAADPVAC
jgi:hypothetical protein